MTSNDRDGDRVDDAFNADDELVPVEAVFRAPPPPSAIHDFERAGGKVRTVFHGIGHGFSGKIPRTALAALAPLLGPDLVLLKKEQIVVPHLDESMRASRARAVWPSGFAGSVAGWNGSTKVNIAIVDGGVDSTHPDLAGRMVGYQDYTDEAVLEPRDMIGHGTHVAGIALGSGASFGVGPGTLSVSENTTIEKLRSNDFSAFAYHLPPSFNISGQATFEGTATTISFLKADDGKLVYSSLYTSSAQSSPLSFNFDGTSASGTHHTLGLRQNASTDVKRFAYAAKITNYPAVGDGFPALRGVAPQSGYYAAKIFPVKGEGNVGDITAALQGIYDLRKTLDIKVVNCSFGLQNGGTDASLRAKVTQLVNAGIVVVASSANSGLTYETGDPGRTAKAITVGAVNDLNQISAYSSGSIRQKPATNPGDPLPTPLPNTDDKPDLVAPGGSLYRSKILSVDSNWNDSGTTVFPDVQKDDYTSNMGTSMAAPVVSGAAALVIQALESKGHVWDFDSSSSAGLVKMLLLATATETNATRENNNGNPVLGRAITPKDTSEGFGMVNVDAAIEAATLTWDFKEPLTGFSSGGTSDRRAWARKVTVPKGQTIKLTMTMGSDADYDVYLYTDTPNENGSPVQNAWSAHAGLGRTEETTWSFPDGANLYVVVKRVSGFGSFTLDGATFACGDGKVDPGEECDDNNTKDGDCCSLTCQKEETESCGFTVPEGNVDGGTDDAGDSDAGASDAGVAPPSEIPQEPEPPPATTAVPTAPPATTNAPPLSKPVERLDPGGGGCSTSGANDFGGGLGLALAALVAMRARLRRSRRA